MSESFQGRFAAGFVLAGLSFSLVEDSRRVGAREIGEREEKGLHVAVPSRSPVRSVWLLTPVIFVSIPSSPLPDAVRLFEPKCAVAVPDGYVIKRMAAPSSTSTTVQNSA
jgi:hypothetical protein